MFSFHNLIDRLAKNTDIYITCNCGRISSVGKALDDCRAGGCVSIPGVGPILRVFK